MLVKRAALPKPLRVQAAKEFTVKALSYLEGKNFQTIAGYYPFKSELDVLPLLETLREQGKAILLPRTPSKPAPLTFHLYNESNLETGKYGIKQPAADSSSHSPDVILVPLLAFDKNYNRLGYGGGYYDRTLANLSPAPITIGCAYHFQQIETLTAEPHDRKLDIIISS